MAKPKVMHKYGSVGSGPEFHVNSGSGRVGSLHLSVGLGRVKKTGPTSNSNGRTESRTNGAACIAKSRSA